MLVFLYSLVYLLLNREGTMNNTLLFANYGIVILCITYFCYSVWINLNNLIKQLSVIEDKLDKTNAILKINETRNKIEDDLKKRRD